jgi:hypothetical protein
MKPSRRLSSQALKLSTSFRVECTHAMTLPASNTTISSPGSCKRFGEGLGKLTYLVQAYVSCTSLRILCKLGMCVIVANTMERCSLFLPLRWGAGPMALMLWLNLVI